MDKVLFMICYRDTTYCVSPDCENKCGRKLTPGIEQEAHAWWGSDSAPIAVACFCGGDVREVMHERTKT